MPTKFNQDGTCLAVYNSESTVIYYCDPLGRCYEGEGGFKTEMLFSTSLLASIDISQRSLTIINTKKQSIICELAFETNLINVKMNRKRVIVELADQLMIYDISNMKLIHTINLPDTKVALDSNDASLIAFQHSRGQITLFDSINLKPIHHFSPHSVEIQTLAFSQDGKKLASASTNGTVVKIYDLDTFQLTNELRRGSTRATIDSIVLDNSLLVLSSSHSTVHMFELEKSLNRGRMIPFPSQITSYLTPQRDFKTIQIPDKSPTTLALTPNAVLVATDHHLITLGRNGVQLNIQPLT